MIVSRIGMLGAPSNQLTGPATEGVAERPESFNGTSNHRWPDQMSTS